MNLHLAQLIDAFSRLKVLVVGEAMLDTYLEGASRSLSREAPVPIVTLSGRRDLPGGAANTAANVRALGGSVTILSIVGRDLEAELLRQALQERGVSTDHVLMQASRRTLAKHRVMADAQMLVRFDQGSVEPISPDLEAALILRLRPLFVEHDVVLVSDYGYGVLTPTVVKALAGLQSRHPRVMVVDSKTPGAYRRARITAVKPNYQEAVRLLGEREILHPAGRVEQMAAHGERLLDLTEARIVAVTLDTDGALIFQRDLPPYRTYARPAPHSRAAGAGDTFLATLALSLGAGAHTPAAAELASAAASVVVGQPGTSVCLAAELKQFFSSEDKIIDGPSQLASRVNAHRRQGRRIVFTNGCFDILHSGHIAYLNRAKALGDVLIVGVNSDGSVRRLKGPGRPINPLADRTQVLSALSCIDFIVAFGENTPVELIRAIRPDVFVKGGDYTREMLPEAPLVEELGGTVELLPYVANHSTSGIIDRIRGTLAETRVPAPVAPEISGQS